MDVEKKRQLLHFAKTIAKEAGVMMQHYYRSEYQVEVKSDDSPVTVADKAINAMLIERVQDKHSGHGVLGEEQSWEAQRDILWVCDPIDGTVAFMQHIPVSMFSLALVQDGVPVVAVAYNPWTNDMYSAIKDTGAYRNDVGIRTSGRSWGAGVHLLGSSHGGISEPCDMEEIQQELRPAKIYTTRLPGTVFKGCLIAEGSADGRTFMHDGAHDIAAIKLIIEEAGGRVTNLEGSEQRYDEPIKGAVMSNGLIHEELLGLVRRYENSRD